MRRFTEEFKAEATDELGFQFAPQVLLFAALKLGIFPTIAEEARGLSSLASSTDCSTRGLRMMLNCLAAMGLLEKENDRYDLNDFSRRYFLPSSEDYIGELFIHSDRLVKLWLALPEAVKTGRPTLSLLTAEEKQRLNISIVEALFQVHKARAWKLVDVLENKMAFATTIKILDVAAGSAVWSIPFALRYRHAEVTAMDFFPELEVARKYTRRFGVENRYRFVAANLREVDFERETYDLVLLGHICHSEGAEWSQRLIRKSFDTLKENGKLLIMDYFPDEERRFHLMPLLMALNALLGTEEGDTFTCSQYRDWLLNEGFLEAQTVRVDDHSPVIVGLRG
jgi:ubiquinone/menaquinone biosynthesis C-methylase UbiE